MTNEVAELDLLIEHRERTARFLDTKATGGDGWRAEKDEMRAWRQQWREVREAFAAEPDDSDMFEDDEGDATASPDTVGLKARGN